MLTEKAALHPPSASSRRMGADCVTYDDANETAPAEIGFASVFQIPGFATLPRFNSASVDLALRTFLRSLNPCLVTTSFLFCEENHGPY
jgi:hypothetical protein